MSKILGKVFIYPIQSGHLVEELQMRSDAKGKPVKYGKNSKKTRNWRECNKSLIKRGLLLLSFTPGYVEERYYQNRQRKGEVTLYTPPMHEFLINIKVFLRLPFMQAP